MRIIIITILLTIAVCAAVAGVAYFFIVRKKGIVMRALNMRLLQITLPKTVLQQGQHFRDAIAVMEHFYSSIGNFKQPGFTELLYGAPYFGLEVSNAAGKEEIVMYVATPRRFRNDLEKQIHGIFPGASIEETEDYNIFHPESVTKAATVVLKKDSILPIRTYATLQSDPLNLITSELTKLDTETEGGAMQILFKPISNDWMRVAKEVVRHMKGGMKYQQAIMKERNKMLSVAGDIASELGTSASQKQQQDKKPQQEAHVDQDIVAAIEEKQKKSGFSVNIRLVSAAPTELRAQEILQHMGNAFAQYTRIDGNEFGFIKAKNDRQLKTMIYKYTFRMFDDMRAMILNTEELSSLFHFSTASLETPKVKVMRSKTAPPPANLPQDGIILGVNNYRGVQTIARIGTDDRRRHLYIIGQTGTGKTSFMENLIYQDMKHGRGVGVVDPHGEFTHAALRYIPKERAEDVVYFDPADLGRPFGLNMLEYDPNFPEQKTFIVNELMKIFDRLYDLKATGGPMFEQYTRNALLLLMDDPKEEVTLLDVPRVLADSAYRRRLLDKAKNVVVREFWIKEAEKAGGEASLANFVPYITSKFNVFIANDFMRPIIGQAKTSLNFSDIMNKKRILLANLSKGRLGDVSSHLLGLIIVSKLMMTAFARVTIPQEERNDFYLYLDEFQNFATDSIATILSEARKYRLSLILAHQFIGQLPEEIKNAVFGNVGSIIAYRIGSDDAQFLVRQFAPVFDESDLSNVDNFNAHAKVLINNLTTKPFNIVVPKPPLGTPEMIEPLRELSRLKYGRERALVEEEVAKRYRI